MGAAGIDPAAGRIRRDDAKRGRTFDHGKLNAKPSAAVRPPLRGRSSSRATG